MQKIPTEQLLGQTESHLAALPGSDILIHSDIVSPLQALRQQASLAGIDLQVVSGFRSFDRQLAIWNDKVHGDRPVLDRHGNLIDLANLSDPDKLWTILRWSALPGTSRHHWGTDLDIWDAGAVPDDYRLQLVPEEYSGQGPFHKLESWLNNNLPQQQGFFRPYQNSKPDRTSYKDVAPEPWHLSFKPVADPYEQQRSLPLVRRVIEHSGILLKATILANLDAIFARYL